MQQRQSFTTYLTLFFALLQLPEVGVAMTVGEGRGRIGHPAVSESAVRFFQVSQGRGGQISIASCTGTFIAPNAILTAAHCLPEANARQNPFVFYQFSEDGNPSRVVEIPSRDVEFIAHPQYSNRNLRTMARNDVAVILLREHRYDGQVLPVGAENRSNNSEYFVVGAGGAQFNRWDPQRQAKLQRRIFVSPLRGARIEPKSFAEKIDYQMSDPRSQLCVGDSGGPLLGRWDGQVRILGVQSTVLASTGSLHRAGNQCGQTGSSTLLDDEKKRWIQQVLQAQSQASPSVQQVGASTP